MQKNLDALQARHLKAVRNGLDAGHISDRIDSLKKSLLRDGNDILSAKAGVKVGGGAGGAAGIHVGGALLSSDKAKRKKSIDALRISLGIGVDKGRTISSGGIPRTVRPEDALRTTHAGDLSDLSAKRPDNAKPFRLRGGAYAAKREHAAMKSREFNLGDSRTRMRNAAQDVEEAKAKHKSYKDLEQDFRRLRVIMSASSRSRNNVGVYQGGTLGRLAGVNASPGDLFEMANTLMVALIQSN